MCDYFCSDVLVIDFVRFNERCFNFVEYILKMVDFKNYDDFLVSFRKLFEIFVILVCE